METHSVLDDNRWLRFSEIALDFGTHAVFREGRAVYPPEEYWKALTLLVERRPKVVKKEELSRVLGCSTEGTLTKQIERIRTLLGDTTLPRRFIKSERGSGYRWVAAAESNDWAYAVASRLKISAATPLDHLPPGERIHKNRRSASEFVDIALSGKNFSISPILDSQGRPRAAVWTASDSENHATGFFRLKRGRGRHGS